MTRRRWRSVTVGCPRSTPGVQQSCSRATRQRPGSWSPSPVTSRAPSARSTWSFRCFMVRTARTALFRVSSSSLGCRTSGRVCWPRRSPWTRRWRSWCSRRRGFRSAATSSSPTARGPRTPSQRLRECARPSSSRCSSSPPAPVPPSGSPRSSPGTSWQRRSRLHVDTIRRWWSSRASLDARSSAACWRGSTAGRRSRASARRSRWSETTRSTTSTPSTSTTRPSSWCPPTSTGTVQDAVRRMAVQAYEALGCEGMARVDFFLAAGRKPRGQRGQHDPGVHAALDVPADVGCQWVGLPRAGRPVAHDGDGSAPGSSMRGTSSATGAARSTRTFTSGA